MCTIRTLTLELLRHGPAHNQLLSPLTPYLALAGNHGAQTVHLPFEHRDFLLRQRALRYQDDRESAEVRSAHLREMGRLLSEVLSSIPGLHADLGASAHRPDELIHLRLILSAAELALLPFEAALAPAGTPGAGVPLALQTTRPLTLTRQSRRHPGPPVRWPTRPRILLAIASPPTQRQVPELAHVAALREALAPWVHPTGDAPDQDNLPEMLTVLTDVSLSRLQRACAEQAYTHVHLLAHGQARQAVGGEQFCLAFHHDRDPSQESLVDGEQLASALRAHTTGAEGGMSLPTVVTLAACDAGNPGSVLVPGASLAHALHEAGIPLVVASQYPLTFQGSVVMASVLYKRLLRGHDPRVVLHDLRQQLRLLDAASHDWASIVAYASFPPDLDAQLSKARLDMTVHAASALLARMDVEMLRLTQDSGSLAHGRDELSRTIEGLERALPAPTEPGAAATRAYFLGHCGSLEKRRAQVLDFERGEAGTSKAPSGEVRGALERSREYYRRGLEDQLSNHWLASQYLSLELLLDNRLSLEWLTVANMAARRDLEGNNPSQCGWALTSLLELELLGTQAPGLDEGAKKAALERALGYSRDLVRRMGRFSFHVHSTRRQLKRYRDWWCQWRPELVAFATALLQELGEAPAPTTASHRSRLLELRPDEVEDPPGM